MQYTVKTPRFVTNVAMFWVSWVGVGGYDLDQSKIASAAALTLELVGFYELGFCGDHLPTS
jgi:uncharacterized membrane protein YfbV (UPF0208 family)